ncbi:ABC transporter ATP-binding protein [Candidatus Lokiarchaeum ossiferum]|uniref:ABC transporter ATP-binding protein n=1 Tax=Candidatus Lokiarchaeum ossiferum TaxID=2951803 RepID=UPI00352DC106
MHNNQNKSETARIFSMLGSKIWFYVIIVIIYSINIAFGFNMVLAFIQKNVFDAAITGNFSFINKAILLAVVTFVIGVPLWMITQYTLRSINKKVISQTRINLFQKIVCLPTSNFENKHSGDLISRSTNDIKVIEPIFRFWIADLVVALFFGVGAIGAIFVMDWRFGFLALGIGVLIVIISFKFAKPLRNRSNLIQKSLGNSTERLIDVIQGIHVTKMFQLEQNAHKFYEKSNSDWADNKIQHTNIISIYNTFHSLFEGIRTLGTLILGLYLLTEGQISIGIIVAAIHLQENAGYFFSNLANKVTGIQTSFSGAKRIFEIMDKVVERDAITPSESLELPELTSNVNDNQMIRIENVNFSYDNSHNLIQHLNMQVSEGQLIAFVGKSGGGKSTLIKLLLGLYPISQGKIFINNKPIDNFTKKQLREMTAYVPQNAFLFNGTIAENIQYGNSSATTEEIMEAAKAAYAHNFITKQKDGYNTLVGERGTHLSGGQRQRIAIARAILKNAPILLLDEATSALDSESEQVVQKALDSLMNGRTTLAVAHRLSTIQHADKIYVIGNGKIVEQGTHAELINQEGIYKNLQSLQYEA